MHPEPNLLLALRAWREGLIDADQLREVCRAAEAPGAGPMADILAERGWVRPEALPGLATSPTVSPSLAGETPPPPIGRRSLAERARELLAEDPGARSDAKADTAPDVGPRYRCIRLHASGGIGRVWLAHDTDLDRHVALKELLPGTGDFPELRRRFVEEAQITGQLEHPGVVPIYELGCRAEVPPFYAMRFIKGRTLAEAIRDFHHRRRQGQEEPLALCSLLGAFVGVCNAVAYAHSRNVVHRDLKGQNVILGDFGEVLVLDWGLAKRMGSKPGASAAADPATVEPARASSDRGLTQPGDVLGTPAYMAPEQASGRHDAVDARTDVFALGAMLYEILTGRPPYQGTSSDDALRQARAGRVVSPRSIVSDCPRALEAVCLKAMRAQPAERYAGAAELAQDIQRWLADEPVSVFPESWPARLARWGRRHRSIVLGSAAVLFVAVIALSVGTVLVNRQRAEAEANFLLAREAVDAFYTKVSEERLLDEPGLQPLREDLLRMGRDFYDKMRQRRGMDPAVRADRAHVAILLGRIVDQRGDWRSALELLREAEAEFAQLQRTAPAQREYRAGLALALLNQGVLFHREGEVDQAITCWRNAVPHFENLAAAGGGRSLDHAAKLALCRNNLGHTLAVQGRVEEGLALVEQAIRDQLALVAQQPHRGEFHRDLAGFRMNLAGIQFQQRGDTRLALATLLQALEGMQAAAQKLSSSPEVANDMAAVHRNLGMTYSSAGAALGTPEHVVLADRHLREALRLREKAARENPMVTRFARDLADTYAALAEHFWRQGAFQDAETAFQSAVDTLKPLREKHPEVISFARSLGLALVGQGNARFDNPSARATALAAYDQAFAHLHFVFQQQRLDAGARKGLTSLHWGRAVLHTERGDWAAAVMEWDRAIKFAPPRQEDELRIGKAQTLARQGDHAAAAGLLAEIDAAKRSGSLDPWDAFRMSEAYSLALAALEKDAELPVAARQEKTAFYTWAALEMLEQLDQREFFAGEPAARAALLKEASFAPLRSRAEFMNWLKGKAWQRGDRPGSRQQVNPLAQAANPLLPLPGR